jgi:DNA-directed RNA polymerase subunit K/omega
MSKPKEEINLNINTELSDEEDDNNDEYEYNSDNDANYSDNDANYSENIIQDESLENTNEYDKINYNDSVTKSEANNKISLSESFLDDDDDDDDIFSITNPEKEMKKNFQIPDNERISRNILTKYESVRLLGTRAKQISDGSKVFVKYDGAKSAMELAELELKHKVIPLKIKRPMPNGKYEIWKISELEII